MATGNPVHAESVRPVRWRGRVFVLAALLLAAIGGLYWALFGTNAASATAYGARIACSCRFVAGREFDLCTAALPGGSGPVMISEDAEEKSVTAWLPLLGSATAQWHKGAGCVLEPWQD